MAGNDIDGNYTSYAESIADELIEMLTPSFGKHAAAYTIDHAAIRTIICEAVSRAERDLY